MKEQEICNARIVDTFLGVEEHGILTFYLALEFQDSTRGFGCYPMQKYDSQENKITYDGRGLGAIVNILNTVGVNSWENLKGQLVRAYPKEGENVTKIGNIIQDKWFSLEDFFTEKKPDDEETDETE